MPVIISGTTGVSGVDGSAGTPAIQGGDANTGVFFPTADVVALAAGGTEIMRISSAGNVGIGTSTPAVKLDVVGAISATGAIQASGVSTNLYPIVSATAVTASGTSVDFTGIPSWVKRITVMFNGVSTNGGSNWLVQIGGSGGIENTGYASNCNQFNASPTASSSTVGFLIQEAVLASATSSGHTVITNVSGNVWVSSSVLTDSQPSSAIGSGTKTLSGTLDRLRIIASATGNPADTFDAGTINIMYE